ncbi:unnamed protein product [Mycena citricolor]|uniref:Uncharacterized protein n=1 Tax=Mycena citricolor TaxID=2018698 RepID=A0AAD2H8H5_9AGAR|nr:unnamed protein product [Mycena citricolor]
MTKSTGVGRGRKSGLNAEQRIHAQQHLSEFRAAQLTGGGGGYRRQVVREWFDAHPAHITLGITLPAEPGAPGIEPSKLPKELDDRIEAEKEKVSEVGYTQAAILFLSLTKIQQFRTWFRNHSSNAKKKEESTGGRQIIKSSAVERAMLARIKPRVRRNTREELWEASQSSKDVLSVALDAEGWADEDCPVQEEGETEKEHAERLSQWRATRMAVRRRVRTSEFDGLEAVEREAIEEAYEKQSKAKDIGSPEPKTPEQLQWGIGKLPSVVTKSHEFIENLTGLVGVTFLVGPSPEHGGKITTYSHCHGQTKGGVDFEHYVKDWKKTYLHVLRDWGKEVFDRDERLRRALQTEENVATTRNVVSEAPAVSPPDGGSWVDSAATGTEEKHKANRRKQKTLTVSTASSTATPNATALSSASLTPTNPRPLPRSAWHGVTGGGEDTSQEEEVVDENNEDLEGVGSFSLGMTADDPASTNFGENFERAMADMFRGDAAPSDAGMVVGPPPTKPAGVGKGFSFLRELYGTSMDPPTFNQPQQQGSIPSATSAASAGAQEKPWWMYNFSMAQGYGGQPEIDMQGGKGTSESFFGDWLDSDGPVTTPVDGEPMAVAPATSVVPTPSVPTPSTSATLQSSNAEPVATAVDVEPMAVVPAPSTSAIPEASTATMSLVPAPSMAIPVVPTPSVPTPSTSATVKSSNAGPVVTAVDVEPMAVAPAPATPIPVFPQPSTAVMPVSPAPVTVVPVPSACPNPIPIVPADAADAADAAALPVPATGATWPLTRAKVSNTSWNPQPWTQSSQPWVPRSGSAVNLPWNRRLPGQSSGSSNPFAGASFTSSSAVKPTGSGAKSSNSDSCPDLPREFGLPESRPMSNPLRAKNAALLGLSGKTSQSGMGAQTPGQPNPEVEIVVEEGGLVNHISVALPWSKERRMRVERIDKEKQRAQEQHEKNVAQGIFVVPPPPSAVVPGPETRKEPAALGGRRKSNTTGGAKGPNRATSADVAQAAEDQVLERSLRTRTKNERGKAFEDEMNRRRKRHGENKDKEKSGEGSTKTLDGKGRKRVASTVLEGRSGPKSAPKRARRR